MAGCFGGGPALVHRKGLGRGPSYCCQWGAYVLFRTVIPPEGRRQRHQRPLPLLRAPVSATGRGTVRCQVLSRSTLPGAARVCACSWPPSVYCLTGAAPPFPPSVCDGPIPGRERLCWCFLGFSFTVDHHPPRARAGYRLPGLRLLASWCCRAASSAAPGGCATPVRASWWGAARSGAGRGVAGGGASARRPPPWQDWRTWDPFQPGQFHLLLQLAPELPAVAEPRETMW